MPLGVGAGGSHTLSEPQGERRSLLCKTVLHLTKKARCLWAVAFRGPRVVSRLGAISTRPQANCLYANGRYRDERRKVVAGMRLRSGRGDCGPGQVTLSH